MGLFIILFPLTRPYVRPPFLGIRHMPRYVAITVDAESKKIPEGIERISAIRDVLEKKYNTKIPITWFVKYDNNFDGFDLALDKWLEFEKRDDEIGWHYHAASFRKEISYDSALNETARDLLTLFPLIKNKYNFNIESFRFGWFFIPNFSLFNILKASGIKSDASYCDWAIDTEYYSGRIKISYDRVINKPQYTNSLFEVPNIVNSKYARVILVHDWTLIKNYDKPNINEIVSEEISFIDEIEKFLAFNKLFNSYCKFVTVRQIKSIYDNKKLQYSFYYNENGSDIK